MVPTNVAITYVVRNTNEYWQIPLLLHTYRFVQINCMLYLHPYVVYKLTDCSITQMDIIYINNNTNKPICIAPDGRINQLIICDFFTSKHTDGMTRAKQYVKPWQISVVVEGQNMLLMQCLCRARNTDNVML